MKLSKERKKIRARNRRDDLERMARCFRLNDEQDLELRELKRGEYMERDRE